MLRSDTKLQPDLSQAFVTTKCGPFDNLSDSFSELLGEFTTSLLSTLRCNAGRMVVQVSTLRPTRKGALQAPWSLKKRKRRLWQSVGESWNGLHQVVVDDHDCEENEEHEGGLVDPFLDIHADIAPHQSLDQ